MPFDMEHAHLIEAQRAQAAAEFITWSLALALHDRAMREVDLSDETELGKDLARRSATLDIAQTMALTENRVWGIVLQAEIARDRLPDVWESFRAGDIDSERVSAIADCARKLRKSTSLELLNAEAVNFGFARTPGELRSWLRRFRDKVEPQEAKNETDQALAERRVSITDNEDGTSWLSALLPTPVAVAIEHRLNRAVRGLPRRDPETGERDPRTRDQKRADLVAHWLTTSLGTETDLNAEIAICIDATDLIGLTDGPGVIRGSGEPVPAAWVRELATCDSTVLRRLVLDPRGRVLDTSKLTYQPGDALREALRWRDGTCRVAGCRAPVHETDLDHADPWHRSHETSAANLRCLCRKHHNMKSHGHLDEHRLDEPPRYRERWHAVDSPVMYLDLYPASAG